jgi:Do/DeqQ family serine protease
MSSRKTTLVYALLIGLAAGMVIASQLDLAPQSAAQSFTAPPMNSAPITGALDAQTFRNVAKAQSPMVVNIRTETTRRAQDLSDFFGGVQPPDDFLDRFFGQPPGQGRGRGGQGGGQGQGGRRTPREQTTVAAGTGFIINKDGLILTNNHVVEDASKIEVGLYGEDDGQLYEAKVIGRDPLTDSALIQLTEKPDHVLPEAKFGDSSQMAAGDWVIAIGNPFNLSHTVSVGVISATERSFEITDRRRSEMLQTDAAINPGNSGGPLLNLRGEVVGMNTAIISNGRAEGNIGIGFAVPINTVRELLPQLHTGKVTRGKIGVQILGVPVDAYRDFGLKSREGALVSQVEPGGAADKGGIQPEDVIVEYNGRPVKNSNELVKMVTGTKPGTSVPVKVMREGRERTLNVTVDELDLEAEQSGGRRRTDSQAEPQDQGGESFGLSLSNITPQLARQMNLPSGQTGAVVTDVDPNGPSAGALRQGDIIVSVNGRRVANASEAGRALQAVAPRALARLRVMRDDGNGRWLEVFVPVTKE